MAKALLTSSYGSRARAGAEVFSGYLQRVFPDLEIIDYSKASASFPLKIDSSHLLGAHIYGMVVGRYFLKLHRDNPFDLVFSNGLYGWCIDPERIGIPGINIYHGTYAGVVDSIIQIQGPESITPLEKEAMYTRSYFEGLSGANKHCISVSWKIKDEVKRYFNLESEVIPNCVDMDLFKPRDKGKSRERLNLPKDRIIGFFPAGATYRKGFDIFIELAKRHKDIFFIGVGSKYYKECDLKNVTMVPRLPYEEMPIYYTASDFVLFPSRYEACALVPLEAAACNIPVIASKVFNEGRFNDAVKLVEGFDPLDYSRAVEEALGRDNYWNVRDIIGANFSFEIFKQRYEETVSRVTEDWRRKRFLKKRQGKGVKGRSL